MNPVYNHNEKRLRAGIRIPVYIFLAFLIISFSNNSFSFYGLEYVFTALISLAFFWMCFRFTDKRKSISIAGIDISSRWWKECIIGIVTGFAGMMLIFVTEWMSGDLIITGFAWERSMSVFWLIPVLGYLLQMLSVGFYEELIARAYLIPNFKEGFTFWKITPAQATLIAVLISSFIFGAGHLGNPNVSFLAAVNITLAGVMLAIPYVVTGRLSYSVGLHFGWNFFQGGFFGFRVSGIEPQFPVIGIHQAGNTLWTGGNFGPEGGFIGLLAILLVTWLLTRYIKKQEGSLNIHPVFRRSFLENQQSLIKEDELA